jgi:hypothetical protein
MNLFIKPKVPGTMVRRPDREGQFLPEEGAWVASSNFWQARLLNGDVVETKPTTEPQAVPVTTPPSKDD